MKFPPRNRLEKCRIRSPGHKTRTLSVQSDFLNPIMGLKGFKAFFHGFELMCFSFNLLFPLKGSKRLPVKPSQNITLNTRNMCSKHPPELKNKSGILMIFYVFQAFFCPIHCISLCVSGVHMERIDKGRIFWRSRAF